MANDPLVSVIVPTHNRPEFLKKTLDSIVRQSYKNIEVFVVSNGANEKNKEVANSFNDPRVTYKDQVNSGGPASPRNHGIREARGAYLAFCDDDDLWMDSKLEKQVYALEKNLECGLCYSKMLRFDEEKEWFLAHEEGEAVLESLLYTNLIPISSVLVRNSLIKKLGGFSESSIVGSSEDYEFLLRYALKTKYYFLNEYLIKYWSGGNRTTSMDNGRRMRDCFGYLLNVFGCYYLLAKQKNFSGVTLIKPVFFQFKNFLKAIIYIFLKKMRLR